jgi:RND superfamily putative drug exporter
MSIFLYRLGRTAYRRPWAFIAIWMLLLGGVVGLAVNNGGGKISSSVTIDGTQSQDVLDQLRTELPAAAGGQGTIVFAVPEGERLDSGERAAGIGKAAKDIAQLPVVVDRSKEAAKQAPGSGATPEPGAAQPTPSASSPSGTPSGSSPSGTPSGSSPSASTPSGSSPSASTPPGGTSGAPSGAKADGPRPLTVDGKPVPGVVVSDDGSVAMLQLQFTTQVQDLPEGSVEQVVDLAEAGAAATGVEVLPSESLKPIHAPIGGHEAIGLGVAALVLLLTLGSLRAAGMPLLTAITGVGIGLGGAFALSESIQLTTATPVLALMVGLAVGMDYALFIVNRQRRLILTQGLRAEEAASRALGTAGSAVLFAGLTVVIALVGLSVIGISFLTTMALVAAATVVLAVLIALTLLPALLGVVGERIASDKARAKGARLTEQEHRGLAHRWSSAVVRHPWLVVIGIVAALGAAAVPMAEMSLSMPNGSTANADTSERRSYDAITRGFGEGYNGPLVVVARPAEGDAIDKQDIGAITKGIAATPDVTAVSLMGADPDGSIAIFNVIPDQGPDDASTAALVDVLRSPGSSVAQNANVSLGVTGLTAVNIDISEKLAEVLPIYIAIIVVLSLLILLLVFRSIVIPIKATIGFLLSIGATFGLTTAVFQWGWAKELFGFDTAGPILSFLPIMVTGILYGLAMDYEVFLVSSMREAHVHGHRGRDAIVHGFDQASRVVLAAAVIMVSVFSGFIFSDDPMIKQFGFALAAGILIDAFLVRMTLVPALMSILGRSAWWLPRWLDRILPNLDVEGDRLKQHLVGVRELAGEATAATAEPVHAPPVPPAVPARHVHVGRPGRARHSETGERPMTFRVPVSRKGLNENRFHFTVDGSKTYDLPLLDFAPVAATEAMEQGRSVSAVLLACDSDETRTVIRGLDTDQARALATAWAAGSDGDDGNDGNDGNGRSEVAVSGFASYPA